MSGNWIIALVAKRVATKKSRKSKAGALQKAAGLKSFLGVLRTTGLITTTFAKENADERGQGGLVDFYESGEHDGCLILYILASFRA